MTAKILADLRTSNTFSTVNFPPSGEDDVVLRATVSRFSWKATPNPVLFIPFVNFSMYLGVPMGNLTGVTAISVDVVKPDGSLIKNYTSEAVFEDSYTIYNMRAADGMGSELADAFRGVMKDIKNDMAADRATLTGK